VGKEQVVREKTAAIHITQSSVKTLKADAARDRVFYDDELPGFGVRVTKAGTKSFVLNYYANRAERRLTIGKCSEMAAELARKKAVKIRNDARDGVDPLRVREDLAAEPTVSDLCDEYVEKHAEVKKRDKSVYEDRRMIEKIIKPKLGKHRVSAIEKDDVETLHGSLKKKNLPRPVDGRRVRDGRYQANRVLALLSKMFTYAMSRKWRPDNPAKGVERFHEDKREAWLTVDQLHALSDALDAYAEQDAADALRLLIVTGARPDEVLTAEWPMFNLQRRIWTKPSHHTKERKIEHVPLNNAALLILRRMAEHKTGIHLFPGRESADPKKKRTARTTLRNAWKQVCKAAGLATEYSVKGKRGKPLPRWRPTVRVYDLRHTFASHLVSRNWSLPLVGKLLGQVRPETTARYAHIADGAQREVANDFDNVIEMKKTKMLA
jgi:integrase